MKARALLILAALVWAVAVCARADDFIYLRKTTTGTFNPHYEVLDYRPSFLNDNILRVPAQNVRGLDQLATEKRGLPNHYVAPVPFSGNCPQFEVHRLEPGVSYMQSIGGGGGAPLARELATRKAATSPVHRANAQLPQSPPIPDTARPQNTAATGSRRPFGWPAYDNPLERPARDTRQLAGNPLDKPARR